jgi:hypothetical protein
MIGVIASASFFSMRGLLGVLRRKRAARPMDQPGYE